MNILLVGWGGGGGNSSKLGETINGTFERYQSDGGLGGGGIGERWENVGQDALPNTGRGGGGGSATHGQGKIGGKGGSGVVIIRYRDKW